MEKKINVIAGILKNESKEILCALCSPVMKSPNLWGSQVVISRIAELKKIY